MKACIGILTAFQLAITCLPLALHSVLDSMGYKLELISYEAIAVIILLTIVINTALCFKSGEKPGILISVLSNINILLLPFSFLYSWSRSDIKPITEMCFSISVFLLIVLLFRVRYTWLRWLSTICLIVLIASVCLMTSFVCMAYAVLGVVDDTVIYSIDSPSDEYYAEVIDRDQGALGGNTVVMVYSRYEFNALLFKITKKPVTVYSGEWREYENISVSWKNDSTLIINGKLYRIE